MRMTRLLTQSLRKAPAGAELPGQRLLLRAGFLQSLAAGLGRTRPLNEALAWAVTMLKG